MEIFQTTIEIATHGQELVDVTHEVNRVVTNSGIETGICTVFVQHTSASLVIQENADPTVRADLADWFAELAPEKRNWRHDDEGPDDMPAHARCAITKTSEVIPVMRARLGLGTWQALYLWEHRRHAHRRRLVVHVQGQSSSPAGKKRQRATDTEEDEGCPNQVADRSPEEQRIAALGQFVASIGHELRNPLNTIETSAYLLAQRLAGPDADPAVAKHLEKIRAHVQVASKIVGSVLSLARNRPPKCVDVHLRSFLEAIISEFQQTDGVRFFIEVSAQLSVWADSEQLRMILSNLLSNALDALAGRGTIRVSASERDGGVSIAVSDDGPGVPAQERSRVFEALHTTKDGGHGLGLALSRRIAEAHGGTLRLEDTDAGASFRLWLPTPETSASARR